MGVLSAFFFVGGLLGFFLVSLFFCFSSEMLTLFLFH